MALAPASWPHPLLNAVRISNKYLLNPLMKRLAGRRHWYAAAVRHTGRRSGKQYVTPVVADRVPDGFVIPLPYGTRVDWLQNVLAAGRAAVWAEGQSYDVVQPRSSTRQPPCPCCRHGGDAHFRESALSTI